VLQVALGLADGSVPVFDGSGVPGSFDEPPPVPLEPLLTGMQPSFTQVEPCGALPDGAG